MDRPTKSRAAAILLPSVALWLTPLPGCGEDKPNFEVLSLEGRIEAIEVAGLDKTISVLYYNEKKKEDVIGTGRITDETEIMINGVVAQLSDLRQGDRVRGQVRVEKKGQKQDQIAMKIEVDRPKPIGGD